jgi:hypothetical protein
MPLCTYKTRFLVERTIVSKNELNNYTLYRYCTSTAVYQLSTVKQHISTATSILTTKSTYHSLSAQRLYERSVFSFRRDGNILGSEF